jgi:hypothetical protein
MYARGTVPCVVDALRSCLQVVLLMARAGLRIGAGVTYREPHALRHTYASLLIQNGEGLAYVRDQLGHASIKITVDTDGHLVPRANKPAVDRLDELTGRNLYATAMKYRGTTQPRKGMSMADKQVTVYSNVG